MIEDSLWTENEIEACTSTQKLQIPPLTDTTMEPRFGLETAASGLRVCSYFSLLPVSVRCTYHGTPRLNSKSHGISMNQRIVLPTSLKPSDSYRLLASLFVSRLSRFA